MSTPLSQASGKLLTAFEKKRVEHEATVAVVRQYGEAQRQVDEVKGCVLDRKGARALFATRLSGAQKRYKRVNKDCAKLLIDTFVAGYVGE
jgi:hypothetical protein